MGICRRDFAKCLVAGLAPEIIRAAIARPKLLVLVLLEQIRADAIDGLLPQIGANGFRKLLYQGAHFPDCRHLSSTFTSTALATLGTGAWPSQHGIVADAWFENGVINAASAEALLATTLTAQVAADPRCRAYVIGMNATQTALFAGTPSARQFFRDPRGQFTTLGDAPGWLVQFNTAKPIETAHNAKWMALDARPGAPPLRTLTYDADHPQEFLNLYQGSPLGQEAQFDLLAALLENEKLGQGDTTDFVCLIAGATEVLGYETGGRDPLMRQLLLHLDRNMEALLARLSRVPGDA